jgi:hypothetical protein
MTYQPHPLRVQRRRTKGWRKPPGSVICDRTTVFGNPHKGEDAVERFREWLVQCHLYQRGYREFDLSMVTTQGLEILNRLPELRGKKLLCTCSLDKPCHVDVLAEWANR